MGRRSPRARVGLALLLAGTLVAAATVPAGAGVEDNKTFTLAVAGVAGAPTYAGDTDSRVVVTITNTSPAQQLGSVNLTLPGNLALSRIVSGPLDTQPGSSVLELRNLALAPRGGVATLVLEVDVRTCVAGTATFSATAKQSNDYSGAGNDFFPNPNTATRAITGSCSLAFVGQPADAKKASAITSVPFAPAGAPITVQVLDAGGSGRATHSTAAVALSASRAGLPQALQGTTTTNAVAGLASFTPGPSLSASAFGYQLAAASPGLTSSAASTSFDIVDNFASCPAGQSCSTSAVGTGGAAISASFGSGGSSTNLLVAVNAADAPVFECAGYPRNGAAVSQFSFSDDDGGDRNGTVLASIPNATKPLNEYEVCWAAPYPFMTESGAMTVASSILKPGTTTPLHVGLLPDCPRRSAPDEAAPCIVSRTYTKSTKTVSITVRASGDDPWRY